MLNHIHDSYSQYTYDGGQAIGEKLRHVHVSRWIMHMGERTRQQFQYTTRVM